jgi:hypothetical protein
MRPPRVARVTFALALLTLLATAWTPLLQTDKVPVVGQVVNGTIGGTVPEGLSVTLHTFSEMEETGTLTTTLSADNTFRFDGLVPQAGDVFVAQVTYQDVTYASEFVTFEDGQPEIALPVTIYETTDEPTRIQITQIHLFINGLGDRVQIGEYHLIGNLGDRTYVGVENSETEQRTTLHITLPDEADELSFDGPGLGERFLELGEGFADTEPIPPGDATVEVLFSYQLVYQEGMQVTRTFDAPVSSVVILLSAEGLALKGVEIVPGERMNTQMGTALSYTAGPLATGEALSFTLFAQPEATMPSTLTGSPSNRNTAWESSIGLVALAVAVAVVYWLWRSPAPGTLPSQARPLVEAIAVLDEDFEAGRLNEGEYRKKRKSLKQQLRALLGGEEQKSG